jgi:hypothetical protein
MQKDFGFLEEKIDSIEEYIFGRAQMPQVEYNESGDWEAWLPEYEGQAVNYETNLCTVYGSLNLAEIFHKFLYQYEPNYSEYFTALTVPFELGKGNNPHKVMEAIRKNGVVEQKVLELPRSREKFLAGAQLTPEMKAKARKWLYSYEFMHEWVWGDTRPENWKQCLQDALKCSPVGVSVSAWNEQGGLYVSNQGSVNNHWCTLYRIDPDGVMNVYDHYDKMKKRLHPDHNIRRAKRIWLNLRTHKGSEMHLSFLQRLLAKLLMKPSLLQACKDALGTDASPKDLANDEVGCAETVTNILRKVYPETPIDLSTKSLFSYFESPKNGWVRVDDYLPETIVLSYTSSGVRGSIGHVGIMMDNGTIASNNSFGVNKGKFTQNFTPATWKKRYSDIQQMPIYLYRRKV